MSAFNIFLQGDFVVGIEFIPTGKKSAPITYEAKLGGSARSFVRKNSQGDWEVPFHHYRLFVTALVPEDGKMGGEDPDEKDSRPDTVFYSKVVNDSFRVFVSLPKNYNTHTKKYPVVYLLDANVYFDILANSMQADKTEALLVGIGYRDFLQMDSLRDRDYTYPGALPEDSFKISGGGERFLAFITQELIPYIDGKFRTNTINRTIMGHSLGGYFTLFALEHAIAGQKQVFRNYVAPSPELSYHGDHIIKKFIQIPGSADLGPSNLFLTYGKLEDAQNGGSEAFGIDKFRRYTDLMQDKKFRQIQVKSVIYPSYLHMETAVPTFLRALKEIK